MKSAKIIPLIILAGVLALLSFRSLFIQNGISEEQVIEAIALVSLVRLEYEDELKSARDLGDREREEEIKTLMSEESSSIIQDAGIYPEKVYSFLENNPQFITQVDNQRKILIRFNDLMENKSLPHQED